MLGFGKVKCFYCQNKVKRKKAFTTEVATAEGDMTLYSCAKCSKDLNELLKEIEQVKNGENGIG